MLEAVLVSVDRPAHSHRQFHSAAHGWGLRRPDFAYACRFALTCCSLFSRRHGVGEDLVYSELFGRLGRVGNIEQLHRLGAPRGAAKPERSVTGQQRA